MGVAVELADLDHLLEAGDTGGEQDVVVRISVDAGIDAVDSASLGALLEDVEEVLTIKTVGSPGKDLALADPIGDGEAGGDLAIVANITELVDVDEDDKPQEDKTDDHHLTEEDGESAEIKCLRFILRTGKDV